VQDKTETGEPGKGAYGDAARLTRFKCQEPVPQEKSCEEECKLEMGRR